MKGTKLEIFVCSAFYVDRCISLSSFMDDNVSHCVKTVKTWKRTGKIDALNLKQNNLIGCRGIFDLI